MLTTTPRWPGVLGAALTLLLVLGPGRVAATNAQGRHAAATAPLPVTYHLTMLLSGARTPTAVEGQLSGLLDSRGVLTATLTATSGLTATVTGMLFSSGSVTVTMRWRGMNLTLSGGAADTGTRGGTIAMGAAPRPVGAWLLTPEPLTHTYTFDARIATGRYRGQDLGGRLVIALQQGGAGRFDGTLTEDDGTALAVTGALVFGNMQLTIARPGQGRLLGDAAMTQSRTILGDRYTLYKGTFAGPGTGDRGIWTAAQEG